MDKISSLPDNVIAVILSCGSLKDAVRTSVLSRGWREQWCAVPQLVFDRKSFPRSRDETQKEYDSRVARIIDQVLLAHQGPIHKFMLSIKLTSCPDIGRWIRFLSRNGVKEFILHIWKGPLYRLPSCLFLFEEITCLELSRCMFNPPSSFTGYSRLAVLDLCKVMFTNNGLEFLLSRCPLLKKLSLKDVLGCTRLRIKSQKLAELSIVGEYGHLDLEYAPLLAIASIQLRRSDVHQISENEVVHNIVNVLGHLPSIERLALLEDTLKELAYGDIPLEFPVLFPLRQLSIHINFGYMEQLLAAFCIFRSSLALEKLDIKAIYCEDEGGIDDDFWQAQEDYRTFSHLRTVGVTKFTGISPELKFIEFVLSNAPLLERLRIEFEEDVDESEIFRELVRFRRSSAKAEIIVPLPASSTLF